MNSMKIRRSTKLVIILFIFVVSIVLGLKKSNLHKSFSSQEVGINDTYAREIFLKAHNFQKNEIEYNLVDFNKDREKISSILQKYSTKITHSDKTDNSLVILTEIPQNISNDFLSELRTIKGLHIDKSFVTEKPEININVEDHLANKVLVKNRIKDELGNKSKHLSEEKINRLEKTLTILQTEIDSLNNQVQIQTYNKEANLFFIKAKNINTENMLLKNVKSFIITTVIMLVLFTLCFVLFYYLMSLFLIIMKKMGIKTSSQQGKYSYNYGKYYGYGRRNKKIKRIYKDKPSSEEDEEEEKEEEDE